MRALREDERDEIESLKHFLKYINSKANAEGWEVWEAMMKIQSMGDKYVLTHIVTEEELSELLDIEDMKEVFSKLISHIRKFVKDS
jgi:hypothetical protein